MRIFGGGIIWLSTGAYIGSEICALLVSLHEFSIPAWRQPSSRHGSIGCQEGGA